VVYSVESLSVGMAALDSGVKASNLGDSVGHCEKKIHMNTCLILDGY